MGFLVGSRRAEKAPNERKQKSMKLSRFVQMDVLDPDLDIYMQARIHIHQKKPGSGSECRFKVESTGPNNI